MKKRISTIPFKQTKEQEKSLKNELKKLKGKPGALLPALQKAQEIYGYLPIEVQKMVAAGMEIPLEEVYGVSTFYAQFNLTPKGEHNISICLGTACYVKGAQSIIEEVQNLLGIEPEDCTQDGKFSLTACRCVGACGLAPVMLVDDDVYGSLEASSVKGILEKYGYKS